MSNAQPNMICFIVLHYVVTEQTVQCIESLLRQKKSDDNSISVIVVDNASPNGSGKALKARYADNADVRVICLAENLGFAKGNNAGFLEAKRLGADFIVLLNNDVIIDDSSFSEKLVSLYVRHKYAVLGPDVYVPRERLHQNPAAGFAFQVKAVRKLIVRARLLKLLNDLGIYEYIKARVKKNTDAPYETERVITSEDRLVLHGSALIFSRDYIDKFDGLYDKTFMYYEEQILAYMCHLNGMKMLYSPDIRVIHYHKASTRGNVHQKNDFFYRNTLDSLKKYLALIEANGEL